MASIETVVRRWAEVRRSDPPDTSAPSQSIHRIDGEDGGLALRAEGNADAWMMVDRRYVYCVAGETVAGADGRRRD